MRVRTAGAVLLTTVVLGASACGEESGDESAGAEVGAAAAAQGAASTAPAAEGEAPPADEGQSADEPADDSASSDGPPAPSPSTDCVDPERAPTIPDESPPPTMAGDMEPGEVPNGIGGEMVPQFGELIVDVGPQGCIDIATQFRDGQRVLMHTHADDGKVTDIRVFAPDGQQIAEWQTGAPEAIEGWDFYNENPLPADGVYVFRIIHREGSDDPFVISFYGQP